MRVDFSVTLYITVNSGDMVATLPEQMIALEECVGQPKTVGEAIEELRASLDEAHIFWENFNGVIMETAFANATGKLAWLGDVLEVQENLNATAKRHNSTNPLVKMRVDTVVVPGDCHIGGVDFQVKSEETGYTKHYPP